MIKKNLCYITIILLTTISVIDTGDVHAKKIMSSVHKSANNSTNRESAVFIKKKFQVIAHRGASFQFPEETITAANEALKQQTDYLEFDLQCTKDNHLVALHDPTIDRTTNGTGAVHQMTLHQLKKWDAGYAFYHRTTNLKILSIEDIFNTYGNSAKYYFETKQTSIGKEAILLQVMKQYHISSANVILESFHLSSLKQMHNLEPKVKLVQLFGPKNNELHMEEIKRIGYGIALSKVLITPQKIEDAHNSGLQIFVYTVEDREQMKKFIRMGVDGMFTGKPAALRFLLAK